MKKTLVIQIPCLNEEETLPITIADLPKSIPGIDEIKVLVIDDGSTDRTVDIARANGVDRVLSLGSNRGLAAAFSAGLEEAAAMGADIVVNTDADNQYVGEDIAKLVAPVLAGRADVVIGTRPISDIAHFSTTKKLLQKLGSFVVRVASGARVEDAPSGFRAFSREAALRTHVHNSHTYTLETIISAKIRGLKIATVPIRVNADLRPSRLVRSIPRYVGRSALVIVRSFFRYYGAKTFYIAALALGIGALATWTGATPKGSWALACLLCLVAGVMSEAIEANRKIAEEILYRLKRNGS